MHARARPGLRTAGRIAAALALVCAARPAAGGDPPVGSAYSGPKCIVTVGPFPVHLEGAPPEVSEGLRQMLRTALFESNWFLVTDRARAAGISAEDLLSDAFLEDPGALEAPTELAAAEVLVTGALLDLEGGSLGLRVKVPGAPVVLGGARSDARVLLELQATDVATGRVIGATQVEGRTESGRATVGGSSLLSGGLPAELEAVRNTPLELAFRDSINRGVIRLIGMIPPAFFSHEGP